MAIISEQIANLRDSIMEMYGRGTHAVLPASRILYGKNKVSLDDICQEIGSGSGKSSALAGTLYKPNGKEVFAWLTSYGDMSKLVGSTIGLHHDQSRATIGEFKVENVFFCANGEVVGSVNGDLHRDGRGSVGVFK